MSPSLRVISLIIICDDERKYSFNISDYYKHPIYREILNTVPGENCPILLERNWDGRLTVKFGYLTYKIAQFLDWRYINAVVDG